MSAGSNFYRIITTQVLYFFFAGYFFPKENTCGSNDPMSIVCCDIYRTNKFFQERGSHHAPSSVPPSPRRPGVPEEVFDELNTNRILFIVAPYALNL